MVNALPNTAVPGSRAFSIYHRELSQICAQNEIAGQLTGALMERDNSTLLLQHQ